MGGNSNRVGVKTILKESVMKDHTSFLFEKGSLAMLGSALERMEAGFADLPEVGGETSDTSAYRPRTRHECAHHPAAACRRESHISTTGGRHST